MIDGVKIKCIGTIVNDWLNNPLLIFCSKVDITTGEILTKNRIAFYRGLSFHIVPSTVSDTEHLFIKGSLATFYNQGKNNAFNYDVAMLAETINELETVFNIKPKQAIIQAFEFGANIAPKQSTKTIIKGLRAYQSYNFSGLKMDSVFNGLQLKRQDTNFKIYDKGLQTAKPETNTLRIEYALHFNKVTSKHGFKVLADFLSVDKLNALKLLLLEVWANTIFYDKGMKWRNMTQKQKEKMLYYLDATNWPKFTKMQRKRAKDNFKVLYAQYCTSTTHTDILQLLAQTLNELTAAKGYHLQNFSTPETECLTAVKMLPFTTLDKPVKGNQNDTKKTLKKTSMKTPKKTPKKCMVCSTDISHKKAIAKYCSKHCNNSNHAKKRKLKRHEIKKVETELLKKLLANLYKSELVLLVEYKDETKIYADTLYQSEITAPYNWTRKVIKVTTPKNTKIVLTSHRAKHLINCISKANSRTEYLKKS